MEVENYRQRGKVNPVHHRRIAEIVDGESVMSDPKDQTNRIYRCPLMGDTRDQNIGIDNVNDMI
jgi:hypothetical protein